MEKDNQHKNINVVKTLYNDCNDILDMYHDKYFAQPLPEDEPQVPIIENCKDSNDKNIPASIIENNNDGNNKNTSASALKKQQRLKTLEARQERDITEQPIVPPCSPKEAMSDKGCSKDCSLNFSSAERERIHGEFWSLNYQERINWISSVIEMKSPERPRKFTQGVRTKGKTRI